VTGAAFQFSGPVRPWGAVGPHTISPWCSGPSAMAWSLRP
jgi:hypothetical protein